MTRDELFASLIGYKLSRSAATKYIGICRYYQLALMACYTFLLDYIQGSCVLR